MEAQILLFLLGFIPGVGPFMPFIARWAPIIIQGLPVAIKLIKVGVDKMEAIEAAHPQLKDVLHQMLAFVERGDPTKTHEVKVGETVRLFGPLFGQPWTREEEERWFNKASGTY